jgi:signal peptidase II
MRQVMPPLQRITLIVVTLVACVGCDQRTKTLAREHLRGSEPVSFLGDTIRLDYTENPGGFLTLGASLPARWRTAAFTIAAGAGIAAILLYALLARRCGSLQVLALSLFCGGGMGNLADRIFHDGYVTDFLNVGVGPLRTGIFNLGDVALMAGCLLLIPSIRSSTIREG